LWKVAGFCLLSFVFELELELIQTHMAQNPLLGAKAGVQ
jgi:hypothetical protein